MMVSNVLVSEFLEKKKDKPAVNENRNKDTSATRVIITGKTVTHELLNHITNIQ